MEFKSDASLKGLSPQLLLALMECEALYKRRLLTLTLLGTGENYVDLQTRGTGSLMSLFGDIKKKLLPAGFEVIILFEGEQNECIRVIYF